MALDQDMDGLPDHQEIILGTDEAKADTDEDGLTDKEEVDSGTNPCSLTPMGTGIPTWRKLMPTPTPSFHRAIPIKHPPI